MWSIRPRTVVARAVCIAVVSAAAMPGPLDASDGFLETFEDDPVAAGRWYVMTGEDSSRFVYDASGQTLTGSYNTDLSTARLVRPLGRTLTQDDSFCCRVDFVINSEGFHADTFFNAQVSFGFLNTTTTGPDRAGESAEDKAYDLVTFDYFPNITPFGGPSLCATIINRDVGQGFYGAIDFEQGPETELTKPEESDLPRDVMLTADIRYRASLGRATLRLLNNSTPIMLNFGGGLDGDPTTITTVLTGPGFDLDAFGILLWKDTLSGDGTTVRADLVFHAIEVCAPSFGDFDADCDVDSDDLALLENCYSGPGVPLAPGCGAYDRDGDNDVDHDDFGAFQREFTGPR